MVIKEEFSGKKMNHSVRIIALLVFSFAIAVFVGTQSASILKLADHQYLPPDYTADRFDRYHEAGIC